MLRRLVRKLARDEKAELEWYRRMTRPFVPGHFYSPIPDPALIRSDEQAIWGPVPDKIDGVNLNWEGQVALLNQLSQFYPTMPFGPEKTGNNRYCFNNTAYSYSDAILLHCMIRNIGPKKIIEVGSGYSSCVILDTNEQFFADKIEITFIEPYPKLLHGLTRKDDLKKSRLIDKRLQDIPLSEFENLQSGDILFIDSTHVSKINSDVNYLFFKIFPRLSPGVWIHLHDIFYPFEYPKEWVFEGRAWNEIYLLHAFLQYNEIFEIALFGNYLHHFSSGFFSEHMPLCLKDGGSCLWLYKPLPDGGCSRL